MRKRPTLVALALMVGAAVLGGLDLWRTSTAPAISDFERAIKRDLPLGSTPAQTVAFLRAREAEDRWISYPMSYENDPFSAPYRNGSLMYASIPDIAQGLLTTGGFYMKFAFDATGHLRDYDVTTVLTVLR